MEVCCSAGGISYGSGNFRNYRPLFSVKADKAVSNEVWVAVLVLGSGGGIGCKVTVAKKKMIQNVCTHITSKRIELESPGWSGFIRS